MSFHDDFDYARHIGDPQELWQHQRGWLGSEVDVSGLEYAVPPDLVSHLRTYARAPSDSSLAELLGFCRASRETTQLIVQTERALEGGPGIVMLKQIGTFGDEAECARATFALSLLFGWPVSQTRGGNLLARVEDEGGLLDNPAVRGHKTRAALPFHCDRADRIGLFCVRQGTLGGESYVVSSIRLRADLEKRAPLVAELLRTPIPQDVRDGKLIASGPSWCAIPIFGPAGDAFVCRYIRRFVTAALRESGWADSTAVIGALDEFDHLLADPGRCLVFHLQPGDLQLLNNNVVLHGRSEYEDCNSEERKRLLLRMWLSHRTARRLPVEFAALYGETEAGRFRGGVWPEDVERASPSTACFDTRGIAYISRRHAQGSDDRLKSLVDEKRDVRCQSLP